MTTGSPTRPAPEAVVERMRAAINAHDLEALLRCFDPGVRSRQPAHPSRAFEGVENVRRNWASIFAAVPDIRAEALRVSVDGGSVWTEWHWHGTAGDGQPVEMRGVTVVDTSAGLITSVRMFMETVELGGEGNAAAIRAIGRGPR